MTPQQLIVRLGGQNILVPQDLPALNSQKGKALALLSDMQWHSATEIFNALGGTEALRRVRDLRRIPGYTVEKRRKHLHSRLFEYRLVKL